MPPPPDEFLDSIAAYEHRLAAALGDRLVVDDLREKHRLMRLDPFLFLRGSCWRWAETAATLVPALADGPSVASVGDAHVGNFGLWRDVEGRLVWGVNDFDEAAIIPYRMDLAWLATSAMLARGRHRIDSDLIDAVLDGYAAGIARPRPFVLERDHEWLRDLFAADDRERATFWTTLRDAEPADAVPEDFAHALATAVPAGLGEPKISARRAGVGSLGRPRFAILVDDAGGPIAREAKAQIASCWDWKAAPAALFGIARGRYRCPDPFLALDGTISIRRLAPNSRKIDLGAHGKRVRRRVVEAMARDIGGVHAADDGAVDAIREDIVKHEEEWLHDAVETMVEATVRDWKVYRRVAKG